MFQPRQIRNSLFAPLIFLFGSFSRVVFSMNQRSPLFYFGPVWVGTTLSVHFNGEMFITRPTEIDRFSFFRRSGAPSSLNSSESRPLRLRQLEPSAVIVEKLKVFFRPSVIDSRNAFWPRSIVNQRREWKPISNKATITHRCGSSAAIIQRRQPLWTIAVDAIDKRTPRDGRDPTEGWCNAAARE